MKTVHVAYILFYMNESWDWEGEGYWLVQLLILFTRGHWKCLLSGTQVGLQKYNNAVEQHATEPSADSN